MGGAGRRVRQAGLRRRVVRHERPLDRPRRPAAGCSSARAPRATPHGATSTPSAWSRRRTRASSGRATTSGPSSSPAARARGRRGTPPSGPATTSPTASTSRTRFPRCLGMSLSGLPFCGPDIGGFGGDGGEALTVDWFKAQLPLPLLPQPRRPQRRPQGALGLRQVDPEHPAPLHPASVQAPALPLQPLRAGRGRRATPSCGPSSTTSTRRVSMPSTTSSWSGRRSFRPRSSTRSPRRARCVLPGGAVVRRRDAATGAPGRGTARRGRETTPLYVRAGAVVPMRPGTPTDAATTCATSSCTSSCPRAGAARRAYEYVADDGLSYGYRRGERSTLRVRVVAAEGHVAHRDRARGGLRARPRRVRLPRPGALRADRLARRATDGRDGDADGEGPAGQGVQPRAGRARLGAFNDTSRPWRTSRGEKVLAKSAKVAKPEPEPGIDRAYKAAFPNDPEPVGP